jgi:hypothetical protein
MADSKSLGFIGFMLGGVTAAVMTIGVFVVHSQTDASRRCAQAGNLRLGVKDRAVIGAIRRTALRGPIP